MNRGGETAKIALGLLKLTVPLRCPMTATISTADLTTLCAQAARKAGADQTAADALATATVAAEQAGNRAVGVAHLFDYLQAYQEGRISSSAVPRPPIPPWGA